MKKIDRILGALVTLSVLLTSACSSGGGADASTDSQDVQASTSRTTQVAAGKEGTTLGVAIWELSSSGVAEGFDASGAVVARFAVRAEDGFIESTVPNQGRRSILTPGESTLSPEAAALLDALDSDLASQLTASSSGDSSGDSLVNKATYMCYRLYQDCDIQGFYGIMYGWWIAYDCHYPASECAYPYVWALRY